jgi:hypothetical protein
MVKEEIKTCRGLEYQEIYTEHGFLWFINIHKPFFKDGKYWFSLNDKLFKKARERGVISFVVKLGETPERYLPVYNEKQLKIKEKMGEVEVIPSKWEGLPPWKRYLFQA